MEGLFLKIIKIEIERTEKVLPISWSMERIRSS